MARLRARQGQGPDGHRAPLHGHQRRREAARPPGTRPVTRSSASSSTNNDPVHKVIDHPARPRARRDHVAAQGRPPLDDQAAGARRASPWRSAAASRKRSCSASSPPARSDDIKRATGLARAMVCEFGMSERMGPLGYGESEEQRRSSAATWALARRRLLGADGPRDRPGGAADRRHPVRPAVKVPGREPRQARPPGALPCSSARRSTRRRSRPCFEGRELPARQRVIIPTYSEKRKEQKEKKRPASIFGAPKPATSS